jgi:hypothetical protein
VLDAGQRKRLAERYASGETMAALAREYDCGEATIWRAAGLKPQRCSNRVATLGAVVLYFATGLLVYLWNDMSWRTEIAHAVSRHQQ